MEPPDLVQSSSAQYQLAQLEDRLTQVKAEVDALQIESMQPRLWYKDAAVVVSIVAVVFSIATTALSYWQVQAQDRHAARAELRSLIQRISVLPKENADLFREYQDDPIAVNQLSSMVNTEYTILAQQAVELSDRIPRDVSAFEYQAIAQALLTAATLPERVPDMLERGLDQAQDVTARVALLRTYATYLFIVGDAEGGRAKYQEALSAAEEYSYFNRSYVAYTNALTQLSWAGSEYGLGACGEAEKLLQQARELAASLPQGPNTEILLGQIDKSQTLLQENPSMCLADSEPQQSP